MVVSAARVARPIKVRTTAYSTRLEPLSRFEVGFCIVIPRLCVFVIGANKFRSGGIATTPWHQYLGFNSIYVPSRPIF